MGGGRGKHTTHQFPIWSKAICRKVSFISAACAVSLVCQAKAIIVYSWDDGQKGGVQKPHYPLVVGMVTCYWWRRWKMLWQPMQWCLYEMKAVCCQWFKSNTCTLHKTKDATLRGMVMILIWLPFDTASSMLMLESWKLPSWIEIQARQ